MNLNLKSKESCKYDEVSLGEIMLRLDPGEGRIRTTRSFRAWEGGGEYNVARGLRRCFNMTTGVITAFADNEVGRLLEDFVLQGRVVRMDKTDKYLLYGCRLVSENPAIDKYIANKQLENRVNAKKNGNNS